jgi:sugar lactone lactonase YvrE
MKNITLTLSILLVQFTVAISQTITTVAGMAPSNNVSATSFGMELYGTVADKHGNIYVSDGTWSVVRKINISTGIATIVAGTENFGYGGDGGQATNAGLIQPAKLALDTAGNLYIGDLSGYSIRKVNMSNGIITIAVGNLFPGYSGDGGPATAAELNGESGIAFDKNNNMYIADFNNNRVREVNAVTQIITTIAGTGTGGYNGDNIAATSAELYYPTQTCIDTAGNVYIAEQSNSRIRKINTSGIIATIAGTGAFAYSGDGGQATAAKLWCPLSVSLDKAGNVYIADWGNNRIREINMSTGIITTVVGNGTYGHSGDGGPATSAKIGNAYDLSFDTAGNYFIVESFDPLNGYNKYVRKVDAITSNISSVAGNGNSDYNGDGIPATNAEITNPLGLTADASGNIYIADCGNYRIRKLNTSGILTTYAGSTTAGFVDKVPATSGAMYIPFDVKSDKNGNLFIPDIYNDRIRKVNTNDSIFDFAGDGFGSPYNGGFSGDNGPATSAELYYPRAVAVDDSGNVFVADCINNRVRKISWNTGKIETVAGSGAYGYTGDGGPAKSARLNGPFGIAVDDSDNIFFVDQGNNCIRKVTFTTGKISTVCGNGTGGFNGDGLLATNTELNSPQHVELDPWGGIYIADSFNSRVRRIDPVTHKVSTIAGNGNFGFNGDGGPATAAMLNDPSDIVFDASGNMYVGDYLNNRVRKVTGVLSVNELSTVNVKAIVYPNPNNGRFTVVLSHAEFASSVIGTNPQIEIYNILGEKIYSAITPDLSYAGERVQVDISNQPAGIYLYRVLAENGKVVGEGKLVIQ